MNVQFNALRNSAALLGVVSVPSRIPYAKKKVQVLFWSSMASVMFFLLNTDLLCCTFHFLTGSGL